MDTTNKKHYNKCFNDMMLAALNKRRREHIVKELTFDSTDAFSLQELVGKSTSSWNNKAARPTDVPLPTTGSANYLEVWFYSADSAALYSTAAAVDGWYDGSKNYDYAPTNKCKRLPLPANSATMTVEAGNAWLATLKTHMDQCNNFRYTIWKGASSVAFAQRGSWVVAWVKYQTKPALDSYTYPARAAIAAFGAPTAVDDSNNAANILPKCLHTDGYNECITSSELEAHNHERISREKTGFMTLDTAGSKKLQELLNDTSK